MNQKKVIITEESINKQKDFIPTVNKKEVLKRPDNNNIAYEMYEKYQNISVIRNHVLTLRKTK